MFRTFLATALLLAAFCVATTAAGSAEKVIRTSSFRTPDSTVACYYTRNYLICQGRQSRAVYLKRRANGVWVAGVSRTRLRWNRSLPVLRLTTSRRDGDHWMRAGISCYADITSAVLQTINCSAWRGMIILNRFEAVYSNI